MKRIFDFTISLLIIILLCPVMILIGILIKGTSKGPIIFKQERIGLYSQKFRIFKFRTMRIDTPNVATNDLKNTDYYITTMGKILRKTSLDEIPQLFNVLKGEMSLVGPRPIIAQETELIELRKEAHVDQILPGITGLAQINGRDFLSAKEKVCLDEVYMNDKHKFKDFKIIISTVFKLIKREGILC